MAQMVKFLTLYLFSNKMLVFRAEVLNIDDRKTDREDPDLGLQLIFRLFWQATNVGNF